METIQVEATPRREYVQRYQRPRPTNLIDAADPQVIPASRTASSMGMQRDASVWAAALAWAFTWARSRVAGAHAARIQIADIPALSAAGNHKFDFVPLDRENALAWYVEQPESSVARWTTQSAPAQLLAKLRSDRLIGVQAALGVPMQTLAAVLRISRPALYKWLNDKEPVQLQVRNRERLEIVQDLAAAWAERTNVPLNSVAHERLSAGGTVLELLTAKVIDRAAVAAAYEELVLKLRNERKKTMGEAGFMRRATYRSLPKDE